MNALEMAHRLIVLLAEIVAAEDAFHLQDALNHPEELDLDQPSSRRVDTTDDPKIRQLMTQCLDLLMEFVDVAGNRVPDYHMFSKVRLQEAIKFFKEYPSSRAFRLVLAGDYEFRVYILYNDPARARRKRAWMLYSGTGDPLGDWSIDPASVEFHPGVGEVVADAIARGEAHLWDLRDPRGNGGAVVYDDALFHRDPIPVRDLFYNSELGLYTPKPPIGGGDDSWLYDA